jgi:hypothetical protein
MSETIDSPLIMTETEAAARLRISRRSLQRLRLDREGPSFVQLTDNRIGYVEPDLRTWMQARTVDVPCPSPLNAPRPVHDRPADRMRPVS